MSNASLTSRLDPALDERMRVRILQFFADHEAGTTALQTHLRNLQPTKTYADYLASPQWKTVIRPRVLARDNHTCRRCRGRANQVHHRSYAQEVMDGYCDEQLASICEGCHNVIQFDDSWKRRSAEETDRLLLEGKHDLRFPTPKYDARKDSKHNYPPEWKRMSAVERDAWSLEYDRQRCLWKLKKHRDNPGWVALLTRRLREHHGLEVAELENGGKRRIARGVA